MWTIGTIGLYYYEAKVYDEPSRFGVDGGRISKLTIYNPVKKCCCQYDREWVIKPGNNEVKEVFLKIMEMYK